MSTITTAASSLPELEILARRLLGAAEGYPPCDLAWTGSGRLRLCLAVAGFGVEDLSVAVAGSQLVVRGRRAPEPKPRHFLHRGIAMRRFQRVFVLSSGLQVAEARLENGLLNIELERVTPPAAQSIPIAQGAPGA